MKNKRKADEILNIPHDEATRMVSRMTDACVRYAEGRMNLNQLWYRCRGGRLNHAIQQFKDPKLGHLLYYLYLDFMCWKDDRDDIISNSALRVARWMRSHKEIPS